MGTDATGASISTQENPMDGKLPMWDASILKNLSTENNAVLAPMHKEGLYVNISDKKMVKFGFLNYMMMYKDTKDSIITEWVELKPSEKWFDAKFSRKYEGKIVVKDWNGKIKKIYTYSDGNQVATNSTSVLKPNKLSSINNLKMDGDGGDIICTVTTTVTIINNFARTCPCEGKHTYAEFLAGDCDCIVKPKPISVRTLQVVVEYDCTIPDDPNGPNGGTGNNGSGYGPEGNPNGGSPNPIDYTLETCNPDPNYVIPTVPPPPGTEYALPCSLVAVPVEGTPNPTVDNSINKTSAQLLIDWFNSDADTQLHLSVVEATFLTDNPLIADELITHLHSEKINTKKFGKWAVRYLVTNTSTSITKIESSLIDKSFDFEIIQNNYLPRDNEPSNYYWRPKLVLVKDFNEFLDLIPLGTKDEDLFNCHYYAFGKLIGSTAQPGSPNWILSMDVNPTYEKVVGNIQVGDRIGYYSPNVDGTGPAWTHSGIVTEVDANGYATKVSSKPGPYYNIIEHHPRDISPIYGSNEPTFTLNIPATLNNPASTKTYPSRIYWRKK